MFLCRYDAARSFFEPQRQVLGAAWGSGFLCCVELEMLPGQCCSVYVAIYCWGVACMNCLHTCTNLRLPVAWQGDKFDPAACFLATWPRPPQPQAASPHGSRPLSLCRGRFLVTFKACRTSRAIMAPSALSTGSATHYVVHRG